MMSDLDRTGSEPASTIGTMTDRTTHPPHRSTTMMTTRPRQLIAALGLAILGGGTALVRGAAGLLG